MQYGYDDAGRPTTVTDWLNKTTTYTYDDAGRLTGIAYPNGVATTQGYRLTETTTYSYDDTDRLIAALYPGGQPHQRDSQRRDHPRRLRRGQPTLLGWRVRCGHLRQPDERGDDLCARQRREPHQQGRGRRHHRLHLRRQQPAQDRHHGR